ncbi:MAG: Rpn family recombination-promoting nuclease/putative transposase [Saprospiraceae bacterium]
MFQKKSRKSRAMPDFCVKTCAMQFVDIKNDIAFRKIFGNENKKIILISFLNAVMKLQGKDSIEDVEILNPYQLPIIQNLKASIIDVKARDKKGKTYIIEMQVAEPDGLDKRLLYYASKDYSQQIESGEYYTQLKPVIFIGIFDFKFTEGEKYLSHHAVCDVENGERRIKDMDFYFIELPQFDKPLAELTEVTDKWIFFIKEAENLEVVPANVDDEGLKAAYQDANKHSWTKEELEAYDYAAMREQDERGKLVQAEKKGERNSKMEIAKEMKNNGEPVDKIIKYTGLAEDEINEI